MSEATARDTTLRALTVALLVAFVCGLLVSVVAVKLRPLQRANVEAERIAQLELVLAALSGIGRELDMDSLEQHMVELASGRFDASIDSARFDVYGLVDSALMGDAAHTAHYSIGSGTKLAMEDAIALANAFERFDGEVEKALNEYELERKPMVDMLQQAAAESSQYFENVQRYAHLEPMQFVFYLLTRSGRISYNEARRRDPSFADAVDRWFFEDTIGSPTRNVRVISPPPMLTPFRLRNMALNDRVVLPCAPTDASHDGIPSDDHRQRVKT